MRELKSKSPRGMLGALCAGANSASEAPVHAPANDVRIKIVLGGRDKAAKVMQFHAPLVPQPKNYVKKLYNLLVIAVGLMPPERPASGNRRAMIQTTKLGSNPWVSFLIRC